MKRILYLIVGSAVLTGCTVYNVPYHPYPPIPVYDPWPVRVPVYPPVPVQPPNPPGVR
jgi:hypothetical protein